MVWIGLGSVLAWVAMLGFRGGFWRFRAARLPAAPHPAPAVGIVVPARNEAGLVGKAAFSLRAQFYAGPAELTVVDDHSTDGTAEDASAAGAQVMAAAPLPAGWTGKMWAVSEGVKRALARDPKYVLLTDADIVHAPDAIDGLVGMAEAGGYDLVSLMVRLHCESMAERALIPAFVFFFFMLYPPRWVADPRRRTAGAAGGTILVRADALRRIGGIEAIHGELIDDCALAGAVKRAGGHIWLGLAGESASIRPYGVRDMFRMISRTAFTQLGYSAWVLGGTVAAMGLIYVAPPLLALAGNGQARWLGLAAWALMTAAYLPAVRFYRQSPMWAAALPAIAMFYVAATVDSALRHWRGRGGAWKGRVRG
jgi:hopene-associated glycosyltransferase HpnB